MTAPPLGDESRERILREARLREAAFAEGVKAGRAAAAGVFERRLAEAERRLAVLWAAFESDDTRVLRRDEGSNGG